MDSVEVREKEGHQNQPVDQSEAQQKNEQQINQNNHEENNQKRTSSQLSSGSANQNQNEHNDFQTQSTMQKNRKLSRIDQENPYLQNFAADMNILIDVLDYKLYDTKISKYTMFTIQGKDRNGEFETQRRYSDFDQLRKLMIKRWPGCFIPPLPSKKAIMNKLNKDTSYLSHIKQIIQIKIQNLFYYPKGNTENSFLNERKKYLHTFCNRIAKLGFLYYSVEFQLFIRHKDTDISKKLHLLEDVSLITIVEKYKGQFYQLSGKEVSDDMVTSISAFQSFLKTSKVILKEQRQSIKELTDHKKNTDLALKKFQKDTIQKYEKEILSQYTLGRKDDMIYINEEDNSELQKNIDEIGEVIELEPFTLLYDLINFELKDTQAFLDALEGKDSYIQKKKSLDNTLNEKKAQLSDLINGKKTLRSIFTKGDAETQKEHLKIEITQLEQEIATNNDLNQIILGIIGMIEIEKYKEQKARQYYEVMTTVSKLELECLEKQQSLWKLINETANKKLRDFNERNVAKQEN